MRGAIFEAAAAKKALQTFPSLIRRLVAACIFRGDAAIGVIAALVLLHFFGACSATVLFLYDSAAP